MKRFSLMIAAMMLLVGFTQCKKDNETPTTDQGVRITLTAGYGQNGGKTGFTPGDGSFVWTNGATEYINVGGSKSGYLGQLTGTGDGTATIEFSGSLSKTPTGETLYFFYLGNGNHAAGSGQYTHNFDFSTQDGTLANVTNYHIAVSDGVVYDGQSSFSASLNMKTAIAFFDLSDFKNDNDDSETVYLHGSDVYTNVKVDYSKGTVYGNTSSSLTPYINLGTASSGKYVVLIPSTDSETTLKFDSNSKTGEMRFVHGIQAGKFYAVNSTPTPLKVTTNALREGAVPGLFSVSATKMIRFSKGNLQYQASSRTWQFAANQYDYIGNNPGNNTAVDNRETQFYWIDLFCWGATGYDEKIPYTIYPMDYTAPSGDISNTHYDWGVHCSITNGGNEEGSWCTLSNSEWKNLLTNTSIRPDNRFVKAKIGTTYGVIVLPDNYVHPNGVDAFTNIDSGNTNWSDAYDATYNWNKIEKAGVAFLPVTGFGGNTGSSVSISGASGDYCTGNYWSTTQSSANAYYLSLGSSNLATTTVAKGTARAVRLVCGID